MARGRSHRNGRGGASARREPPEQRVARWIGALPEGATLAWSEDTIPAGARVARGWLDVRVPDLCEEASMGWVWSVEGSDLPDPGDGPLTLQVPYDAHVDLTLRGGSVIAAALVAGDGTSTPIRPDEVAHWAGAARLHGLDGEDEVRRLPVWTPEAISSAVAAWCAERVGRADLQVRWDEDAEPSPLVRDLERLAEQIDAQGLPEDAVMLGEGLFALPDAFDDLLAMGPDEAAKVTGALSAAQARQRTHGD